MADTPTEETSRELVRPRNPKVKKLLPVSSARVYQLIKSGALPHYRVGDVVLIDLRELEEWILKHRQGGTLVPQKKGNGGDGR